jgi:hypothetical protein
MTGLHERPRVGAHKRHGHRQLAAIGEDAVGAGPKEFDDAEQIVPPAGVQTCRVVPELVENLIHLERREDRFDQHRGANGSARDAKLRLSEQEDVIPQPCLEMRLQLR